MSLDAFQAAWATLLLNEQQRECWRQGNFNWPDLSEEEQETIKNIPENRLDAIASAAMRGRREVYFRSLPRSVHTLLPEEIGKRLATIYALTFPEKDLYPRHQKFPEYLLFLKQHLPEGLSPHLPDILAYEAVAASLVFYRLPSNDETSGLAPNAGLLIAGSHLEEVLKRMKTNQPIDDLPATPKDGYLLQRTPITVNIERLHWAVFEILNHFDGLRSWAEIVDDLIHQEPVLRAQKEKLLAWKTYFLKKGLLFDTR